MDDARFREAEDAYAAGDFRAAAKGYLAAAGRGREGNGLAYHKAGNSLMRLRRHGDAVTVYGHALMDEIYDKRGVVYANLGAAHAELGAYDEAVRAYRSALEEPGYDADYKALQGMAGALWEMGRMEDAALAYRQAALDSGNPDPGKALNNLGLCLMRLDRPEDAIEAYKAALELPEYRGKGRAAANLGIAYASVGKHEDALRAFEKATALYDHALSPETAAIYEASRRSVTGHSGERPIVEGWVTGEIPPVFPETPAEETGPLPYAPGLDNVAEGGEPSGDQPGDMRRDSSGDPGAGPGAMHATTDDRMSDFFSRTDEEMRVQDREARREEKRARREDAGWKGIAVWVLGAGAVLVVLGVLYLAGFGFPSQASTVNGMLDARAEGRQVERFWVAVPQKDIDKEMAKIPGTFKSFTVDGVDRGASSSTADVTLTLDRGAPLHLKVTFAREGVGWKVTGIENDWRSTGGGS